MKVYIMSIPKTPVRIAIEPLLNDAQKAAEDHARDIIARVMSDLEANGWDIQRCAPWPSTVDVRLGHHNYDQLKNKNKLYLSLVCDNNPGNGRSYVVGAPDIVKPDLEAQKRFVEEARHNAALQYESFIQKLENKIGSHSKATLAGSHVWGYSFLTVVTPEGEECWKTHSIINVSKLGKLFNQYPTRKVKTK